MPRSALLLVRRILFAVAAASVTLKVEACTLENEILDTTPANFFSFAAGCLDVDSFDIATFSASNAVRDFYEFYLVAGSSCVTGTFDGTQAYVAKLSRSDAQTFQLGPVACGDTAGTGECCIFALCANFAYDCSKPATPLVFSFSVDPPSPSPTPSSTVTPSFSTGASASITSTVSASQSPSPTSSPSGSLTPSPSHTPTPSRTVTPSSSMTPTPSVTPGGADGDCIKSITGRSSDALFYCERTSSSDTQNVRVALVDLASTDTFTVRSAASKYECDRAYNGLSCKFGEGLPSTLAPSHPRPPGSQLCASVLGSR